jgi:hypothetical protein
VIPAGTRAAWLNGVQQMREAELLLGPKQQGLFDPCGIQNRSSRRKLHSPERQVQVMHRDRFISRDGRLEPSNARCSVCRHFLPQTFSCRAFPSGISNDVFWTQIDHRAELPGDHGIRFEPLWGHRHSLDIIEGSEDET